MLRLPKIAVHRMDDGVPASLVPYGGMFHGFYAMAQALDAAKRAVAEAAGAVRAKL